MRILSVQTEKSFNGKDPDGDGIEEIRMSRLGDVVLLAGKNGAGKTRILNKIFITLTKKPSAGEVKSIEDSIVVYKNNIRNLEVMLGRSDFQGESPKSIEDRIKVYQSDTETAEELLGSPEIETDEVATFYKYVRFVPKKLDLSDSSALSKDDLASNALNVDFIGMHQIHNGTLAKIQYIQDRWFNVTHQSSRATDAEKEQATADYTLMSDLIRTFLNGEVDRSSDGAATLFGFPIGKANLSDGQKILLQFCVALYSQGSRLTDLILVLDEPENHLHPSVIIEIIEKIRKYVTNGQLWIATHSVPLLAHFDPACIWYVEDNRVTHAGKIPEKVLQSLLGDAEQISKLQDFISLPAQFASTRYAFESLFEPRVVLTGSEDPQSYQIREALLKRTSKSTLRVLDYGAGKGRLISNIAEIDARADEALLKKIDYIAFDKYAADKKHCEAALVRAYGSADKRYFNDWRQLLSVYDKGSFDVVVMCNVLHEIDPLDWIGLFEPGGSISTLLQEHGILLLVEDHQIPTGEMAYQKGFLILDTPQLKDLFRISEKDSEILLSDFRGDNRLKAHQISRSCLLRINARSRKEAIKALAKMAKDRIVEIREKEKNYSNGKLHGFWTQQFANAQLNLAEL